LIAAEAVAPCCPQRSSEWLVLPSNPSGNFRAELDALLPAKFSKWNQTSIDSEVLPGDERRRVTGEKHGGIGDVVGNPGA
jgi:hypothetical protein